MKIGTRGSDLALAQANGVAERLRALGAEVTLEIIRTQGDDNTHLSFEKLEGKGFFTKEIEDALLAGHTDLAVHSLKDLPTESPQGLVIAAIPSREDVRDCLLVRREAFDPSRGLLQFKEDAVIGTSEVRRKAQLAALRPDARLLDLRGNVPTRVRKLREGAFDAIVLARAGLLRLQMDLSDLDVQVLDPEAFVPAPGQGALALQVRANDPTTHALVRQLHYPKDALCVEAERTLLARLDSGCHLPLGAHAVHFDGGLQLVAFLGGQQRRRAQVQGDTPEDVAEQAYFALTLSTRCKAKPCCSPAAPSIPKSCARL